MDAEARWVAVGGPGAVTVLDARSGELVAALDAYEGRIWDVAFAPDGRRLFAGDADGWLHVYDTARWQHLTTLPAHDAYVYRVTAVPGTDQVVTASGDGTVRLWDATPVPRMLAARREHRRLVEDLEPKVLALLDGEGLSPDAAVPRLEADTSLGVREREVALQVLLRESVARDPDPLGDRLGR